MTTGALVLAATPIGDPADAAPRLSAELTGADLELVVFDSQEPPKKTPVSNNCKVC